MTETPEELKARARALRNKPANNTHFNGDENNRRGKKAVKPRAGVKTSFRKPSV